MHGQQLVTLLRHLLLRNGLINEIQLCLLLRVEQVLVLEEGRVAVVVRVDDAVGVLHRAAKVVGIVRGQRASPQEQRR